MKNLTSIKVLDLEWYIQMKNNGLYFLQNIVFNSCFLIIFYFIYYLMASSAVPTSFATSVFLGVLCWLPGNEECACVVQEGSVFLASFPLFTCKEK